MGITLFSVFGMVRAVRQRARHPASSTLIRSYLSSDAQT
jgi:hypothetical protein